MTLLSQKLWKQNILFSKQLYYVLYNIREVCCKNTHDISWITKFMCTKGLVLNRYWCKQFGPRHIIIHINLPPYQNMKYDISINNLANHSLRVKSVPQNAARKTRVHYQDQLTLLNRQVIWSKELPSPVARCITVSSLTGQSGTRDKQTGD